MTRRRSGPRPARSLVALVTAAVVLAGCSSLVAGRAAVPVGGALVSTSASSPAGSTPVGSTPVTPIPGTALDSTGPDTAAPAPTAPTLPEQHDKVFATLMTGLAAQLRAGDQQKFLTVFAAPIAGRVGRWFGNTKALGVSAALFSPTADYPTGATDAPTSFTRTVVLGVRTPYDDDDSMPGVTYLVTVVVSGRTGALVPRITGWNPKYVVDPMNCDCEVSVVHQGSVAVVAAKADQKLMAWQPDAVKAGRGVAWSVGQLAGTGLRPPRGQVVFLADKPFQWFIATTSTPIESNVTIGLAEAAGDYPGSRLSRESRIVLMLRTSGGDTLDDNAQGRQYAADVITHESTHQLMNANSTLPGRSENSPPTWVSEGIATAVETLFRDSLGEDADIGYPEPNDPKNTDSSWYTAHLTDQMPTRAQLYSTNPVDATGYYALSGSVFRYLETLYGYSTMMSIAKKMYTKPAQTPFDFFPDPDKAGSYLSGTTAHARWKKWFQDNYVS